MALSKSEIRAKLGDAEDNFVERKREGANSGEIRKTLVAFANSVPEGEHGILFLGVDDDGAIMGVTNTDNLQKTVRSAAENDCYPPIKCTCAVLTEKGRSVIAVVVEFSKARPHFAGPAYVRRGSESVKASPELYNELIASRNDKARRIIQEKGKKVSLEWKRPKGRAGTWDSTHVHPNRRDYRINNCDAHCVEIEDLNYGELHNISLERVLVASVRDGSRLRLVILD